MGAMDTCNFGLMMERSGALFKRIYSVVPIEAEPLIKPIDYENSLPFLILDYYFQQFKNNMRETARSIEYQNSLSRGA